MKFDENLYDVLYSDAALLLGEIHWIILQSTHLMERSRWNQIELTFGKTYENTEFGMEVGMDEIHWWIFKKEPDVDGLATRTEATLKAVQKLYVEAAKLKRKEPETYTEVLLILRTFADENRKEIEVLHNYVSWLAQRHPMAPRILFTYRIWGSTRMADREIELGGAETPREDMAKLRTATEIVLGVCHRYWRTIERVYAELVYEVYENIDPEAVPPDFVPAISERRVARYAGRDIFDNCAVYFTELRQSLRNILIDCKKMKQQYELFNNEKFWQEFIPKAAKANMSEPELWDFKETLTIWHVKDEEARRKAKITFAEDVASFANASGGVLIVGVTDEREIVGVGDGKELENRLKVARDVLASHIKYENEIVSFRQVRVGEENKVKLCLVIVISKAYKPVSVRHEDTRFSYPVRRESGITRVAVDELSSRIHEKSDRRDFMSQLEQFVREN